MDIQLSPYRCARYMGSEIRSELAGANMPCRVRAHHADQRTIGRHCVARESSDRRGCAAQDRLGGDHVTRRRA
ncbi:hypothetical protein DY468_19790 [Rhodopseudomonas sp. BR0M22]|nr:hypothetical protein [Rhodopseudomonas sp. BR0M22]